MRRNLFLVLALVLAVAGGAFAQGTQSGTLSGTVLSSDRQPLPGVTVNLKSPALLGTRSAVTDANGGYIFKALPPGSYKVTYDLAGFATVERAVTVVLGGIVPADVTLKVATVQETVTVTGEAPSPLSTTQVGANIKKDTVDTLATGRTLQGIATLAPGLTTNTPNAGQVTIAGSFAFDNVFLLDGVDINDNLFGSANSLFIEDAIEETQVLTSGISAEYGRFSGGVINAITKRGGNQFSGSLRGNFSKPQWRDETPFEKTAGTEREGALSKFYEGTFGGPIVKDRLWFFAAGRKTKADTQSTSAESGIPFDQVQDQKRYEGKLSGAINPNHTFSATYTKVVDSIYRTPFGSGVEIDPIHTAYTGEQPNDLISVNYNGVLKPNLFAEVQFSRKKFGFVNSGGTSKDLVDSPILALTTGFFAYNAPYFDATDPENRDNRQLAASLSYFASTGSLGKHDIKVGYENYRSTRTGGNSQSSTDWVFYADWPTDASGKPVFDSNGYVIPVFETESNYAINYQAVRGAQIDLTTQAGYVNDRWTLNNHWSFNLGARAEWQGGKATGGIQPVKSSRIVPRLAASFDVRGDGKFKLDATYSHYSGKVSETQFANNTNVGNPNAIYYLYTGPSGQGRSFAPGFDLANYTTVLQGSFPTANIFYDKDIKSPVTKEWTAAAGVQLGNKGYVKAIYTHRTVSSFVQQFITTDTGQTDVVVDGNDFGTFSNRLWANTDDGERKYDGLQFQTAYRLASRWNFSGNYTLQINNDGNQEGEGVNTPGSPSVFSGYYPEIFNQDRTFPIGHLSGFQKHRARAWTTYDLGLGRVGSLNAGFLWRYDSGQSYSIRSTGRPLTTIQKALGAAAGYPDLPTTQTIFYSLGRGSENYEAQSLFDLAVTYSLPLYKRLNFWVKGEARNIFDSTPLISYNITTTPDASGPKDALGIPTNYIKGVNFGKGTGTANYPFPREFFVTVGMRF
jgi:Carboxypeptidase regulatory-like domain/TonB dependent receptor/TonB-dependent Receptor Plug Domain